MEYFLVKCQIPSTVYVGESKSSGLGVISKQDFKKGDVIYKNSCLLLDINKIPERIIVETDQGNFELNKFIHASHHFQDMYMLYNFDSYTNHSCDPNTNCVSTDDNDPCPYECVALKDIKAGDELTANYNGFYYDVKDPFDCNCGSDKCYGRIAGFKNLTVEQQKELKDDIDKSFYKVYDLAYLNN
jgi:SET domain-containing protein